MARSRLGTWLVLAAAGALLVGAVGMLVRYSVLRNRVVAQKQAVLLAPGNAEVLYKACEEMWRNSAKYRPDLSCHPATTRHLDPTQSQLPPLILALKPNGIRIEEDLVMVDCGNKLYRFGIIAFMGSAQTQPDVDRWVPAVHKRALWPGLYYYSDDARP